MARQLLLGFDMKSTLITLNQVALVSTIMLLGACTEAGGSVDVDPEEAAQDTDGKADGALVAVPDVKCVDIPVASAVGFRHSSSRAKASGEPIHRGLDPVIPADAASQRIAGIVGYGTLDHSIDDETVSVYACRSGKWKLAGRAYTNSAGEFAVTLSGTRRLPVGLRDMYMMVEGDGTGTRFTALVAPDDVRLIVSDVDGTLSSHENAFPESLLSGDPVALHPHAPAAFKAGRARGYVPVYLTARGNRFTGATRQWLADNGMPRGLMRLSLGIAELPGEDTIRYKTGVMKDLQDAGLTVSVGIGNRASDIEAYETVGVASDKIFIKLPEYLPDVQQPIADRRATGVNDYAELVSVFKALPTN